MKCLHQNVISCRVGCLISGSKLIHCLDNNMICFQKEIADGWMDNIDWIKVKELSKVAQQRHAKMFNSDDEDDDDDPTFDKISIYKDILTYVKPGETVTKAIKRLGGSKQTKSWAAKKKQQRNNEPEVEEGVDKEAMLKLTELVDKLSQRGEYDIYTYSYEKLTYCVREAENQATSVTVPDGTSADDALDMFADNIDDKTESTTASNTDSKGRWKKDIWEQTL